MPEAEYLLGVCLMNHGQLEKAVSTFLQIIESNPSFRKNMYLLAAISNKRMNKL
jgi:TolA-binding protein